MEPNSAPTSGSGPLRLPPQILLIGMGAAVALVVVVFALTALRGGSGGGGSRTSDLTLAFEPDGSHGDLYLIDRLEDAENLAPEDRVLRDVALGGRITEVDEDRVLVHDFFSYEHEGGPLFAYQENGSDRWVIAVLDGREVVEIDEVDDEPDILVTESGPHVIEKRPDFCSIRRLSGRSTEQVVQAKECAINGSADKVIITEQRSSGIEVTLIDLGSGEETTVVESDDASVALVSFSPNNQLALVSPLSRPSRSILINLETGATIAEEELLFGRATNDGFFSQHETSVGNRMIVYRPITEEVQEIVGSDGVALEVDSTGSIASFIERDGENTTLSMAPIGGGGIGPLVEVAEYHHDAAMRFIGKGHLLVVDGDGAVEVVDGQDRHELGQLEDSGRSVGPTISPIGAEVWAVSLGQSIGVVHLSPNPVFIKIDELEWSRHKVASADGRWLAMVGSEAISESGYSLVLVDLVNGESEVIDMGDSIANVQFSGDHLHFETVTLADRQAKRVRLRFGERPENIAQGVALFVPGDPTPTAPIDRDLWLG